MIELHGSLHKVLCLDCGIRLERDAVQLALEAQNAYLLEVEAVQAPDGDTLRLKPDVVFFGENVAPLTASRAMAGAEQAAGLLVIGSSLMAYSAFRLCKRVAERGKPLIAVNLGKTRADDLLDFKFEAPCEQLLPLLAERLG